MTRDRFSSASYPRLAGFIAPAAARPQIWRVLVALGLTAFAFLMLSQAFHSLVQALMGPVWGQALLMAMQGGRTALGVIAVLAGFLPLTFALALAVRVLHDRGWTSLLDPMRLTRATAVWVALGVLAVQAVLLPIQVLSPDVGRHLTLAQQAPWLIPAILGIIVQAGTEEMIFRGYLLQQLATLNRSRWIWMILPSVLFAGLHLDPSASWAEILWSTGTAFGFGLIAADLTARTGTLGPAIGLHVATNLGSLLVLGLYGRLDGLALWNLVLNPMRPWDSLPYMAVDALGLLVAWLTARVILRV